MEHTDNTCCCVGSGHATVDEQYHDILEDLVDARRVMLKPVPLPLNRRNRKNRTLDHCNNIAQRSGLEERLQQEPDFCSSDIWKTPEDAPNTSEISLEAAPCQHAHDEPEAESECPRESNSNSPSSQEVSLRPTSSEDFCDDREFEFLKVVPLPRSSSLKSQKTPPGTPTRRKSVRFADVLGLELECVRHILNPDEPPTIITSATRFLGLEPDQPVEISYWLVCFPQPVTNERLLDLVLERKVSLENCFVNNSKRTVYGTVRVANVAYRKLVTVRYTFNGWLTYEDAQASYIAHSNDLVSDRFSFELKMPDHFGVRSRMEFAVIYSVEDQVYWDNNCGSNYALECVEYREL